MNFTTKLIVSLISIATTIVGSIYGGFEVLDMRMDHKVDEGEKRVMTYIHGMKATRDEEIKGIKAEFVAEVGGVKTQLVSMDGKLNILLSRRQVTLKKDDEDEEEYYTIRTTTPKEDKAL